MVKDLFKGAIFDLDGVLVDTAKVHAKAWKALFDEYLEKHYENIKKPFIPFDSSKDYGMYVDGKPRYDGVDSFLKSRGIELPWGNPKDVAGKETVCGLGNKKNFHFQELIKTHKPVVFDYAIKFVKNLKRAGVKVAIASSSKNAPLILKMVGIYDLFEAIVDGNVSAKKNLKGKPKPDIFLEAAKMLKLFASDCIVVEDALSGVKAGKNGNFGMVLGIDRKHRHLYDADIEIGNFKNFSLNDVRKWFNEGIERDGWTLTYKGYSELEEPLREVMSAIGNGYFGVRSAQSITKEIQDINYPGTYIAGLFNNKPSKVHGKIIYNEYFEVSLMCNKIDCNLHKSICNTYLFNVDGFFT